jgi:hypothetical protein
MGKGSLLESGLRNGKRTAGSLPAAFARRHCPVAACRYKDGGLAGIQKEMNA